MAKPITITVPHQLGQAEARRRLEQNFAALGAKMTGGLATMISFDKRWVGDRLDFAGGALGQKVTGRIEVLEDSVIIQIDLPAPLLAGMAERMISVAKRETQKLLEKR